MADVAPFRPAAVEPVPAATQLASLSFVSGISGMLAPQSDRARVVLHRVIARAQQSFLQQASPYAGTEKLDHSKSGRVLPMSTGVVGFALKTGRVARTKKFSSTGELETALKADMVRVGDNRSLSEAARSYLAIPMLAPNRKAATVLYADTFSVGTFADDKLVATIVDMAQGFCRIVDQMTEEPLPSVENFPLEEGNPVLGEEDVYKELQELVPSISPPRYSRVTMLNLQSTRY